MFKEKSPLFSHKPYPTISAYTGLRAILLSLAILLANQPSFGLSSRGDRNLGIHSAMNSGLSRGKTMDYVIYNVTYTLNLSNDGYLYVQKKGENSVNKLSAIKIHFNNWFKNGAWLFSKLVKLKKAEERASLQGINSIEIDNVNVRISYTFPGEIDVYVVSIPTSYFNEIVSKCNRNQIDLPGNLAQEIRGEAQAFIKDKKELKDMGTAISNIDKVTFFWVR